MFHDLLPAPALLAAFIGASLILAITPGPAVLYIVTRSARQGRRSALASVAGVACGNLGNALGAALGLAALFAVSTLAYSVVKYCGAAYLFYLGVRALRGDGAASSIAPEPLAARRLFVDGALVALFNPKTALFYAAFLPQFIDAHGNTLAQVVALGALFVMVAACTDTCYALAASTLGPRLARGAGIARVGRFLSAAAFFGLGTFAALSSAPERTR